MKQKTFKDIMDETVRVVEVKQRVKNGIRELLAIFEYYKFEVLNLQDIEIYIEKFNASWISNFEYTMMEGYSDISKDFILLYFQLDHRPDMNAIMTTRDHIKVSVKKSKKVMELIQLAIYKANPKSKINYKTIRF